MAEKILIMGESGTGKSTSIRNCDPVTTAIVNPVGKPLPFRGSKRFTTLNGVTDSDQICRFMKEQAKAGKKIIIVDDFQYILAIPFMNRIKENGWDKWNDFGESYFKIIDVCKDLPQNVCVYYMTHTETLENGVTTVKLIGKLLREKITIEGLFTIVLKTGVSEGNYYFFTQNSGKDTVKSPMGMFDSFSIENDLAYVDAKIRNYYEFDDAVSDDDMAKLDEEKAGEVEKPHRHSRRGTKVVNIPQELEEAPIEVEPNSGEVMTDASEAEPKRRHSRNHDNDGFVNIPEGIDENLPFAQAPEVEAEPKRRGHRSDKSREEVIESNNQKLLDYMAEQDKAIEEAATGDQVEVPFEEIKHPEPPKFESVPNRKVSELEEAQDDVADAQKAIEEVDSDKPKRRTRKVRE